MSFRTFVSYTKDTISSLLLTVVLTQVSLNFYKRPTSVHNFHNSNIKALEEINITDVTPVLEDILPYVKENQKPRPI